jgi:drug/metabolite transporter (DMT)-like permease
MQSIGIGAGLAAMAFWGFIATAVVAGVWDGIRKREARHETIRRLVESGQPIDKEMMEKLLLWILPVAVGVAVLGEILGYQVPQARLPILGAAALLACLGIGYFLASKVVKRWYHEDDADLDQLNG